MYFKSYTVNFTKLTVPSGDVDGNGRITVPDVVALRSIIMGRITPDEIQFFNADLDM